MRVMYTYRQVALVSFPLGRGPYRNGVGPQTYTYSYSSLRPTTRIHSHTTHPMHTHIHTFSHNLAPHVPIHTFTHMHTHPMLEHTGIFTPTCVYTLSRTYIQHPLSCVHTHTHRDQYTGTSPTHQGPRIWRRSRRAPT